MYVDLEALEGLTYETSSLTNYTMFVSMAAPLKFSIFKGLKTSGFPLGGDWCTGESWSSIMEVFNTLGGWSRSMSVLLSRFWESETSEFWVAGSFASIIARMGSGISWYGWTGLLTFASSSCIPSTLLGTSTGSVCGDLGGECILEVQIRDGSTEGFPGDWQQAFSLLCSSGLSAMTPAWTAMLFTLDMVLLRCWFSLRISSICKVTHSTEACSAYIVHQSLLTKTNCSVTQKELQDSILEILSEI